MRFVHNAQTLIGLTAIYWVWASWNPGTELHSNLTEFLNTVSMASQIVEQPDILYVLVPETQNYRTSLNRELAATLGYFVVAYSPSLPIQLLTAFPEESAPIGTQWRGLQNQRWLVPRLVAPRNGLEEVRAWLDGWRPCLTTLRRHVRELRARRRVDSERLSTATVLVQIVGDATPSSGVVTTMIDATVYVPQRGRSAHPCRFYEASEADLGEITPNNDLELLRERKVFGPHPFVVQRDTISLPSSAFDRYPYLEGALDVIGEYTPTDALTWAEERQLEGLRGREARLFGASIAGEHLRYVGPVVIIGLHVYMLVTLYGLYFQKALRMDDPIPWLAAVPSLLPTVFSGLTLTVVPATALGLMLWRLTTVPIRYAAMWTVVTLGLGTWIVVWARMLGVQCKGSA